MVSTGDGDAHRESSMCLSLLPFSPTASCPTTSTLPPAPIAPKGKSVASDQHIPELHGPTHIPAQKGPFNHSLASECPKNNPSSLAMETSVQPSCRGQAPASCPSAPLQTPVWPLALPRCVNHPCAVTCVPMLGRVCRAGPQRDECWTGTAQVDLPPVLPSSSPLLTQGSVILFGVWISFLGKCKGHRYCGYPQEGTGGRDTC